VDVDVYVKKDHKEAINALGRLQGPGSGRMAHFLGDRRRYAENKTEVSWCSCENSHVGEGRNGGIALAPSAFVQQGHFADEVTSTAPCYRPPTLADLGQALNNDHEFVSM